MNEVAATLGLDLPTFLWHLVNFIVLIALLTYFLYRPIGNMLDERSRRIEESLAAAEQARAEVARADREREEMLASTRREIQELMAQAQQTADRFQAEQRANAQQEAQRIIERAQQEAAAERDQAMSELRREVASLAVQAAERIIRQRLDGPAQQQLIEEFLSDQAPASQGASSSKTEQERIQESRGDQTGSAGRP
jgi:F-type H+-transporting ATPase subunit b